MAAQNIVPNPGFELRTGCTTGQTSSKLGIVQSWEGVSWTPDYFNLCNPNYGYHSFFGYQWPRTGDGHMGMYIYVEPSKLPPIPGWDTFYSENIMCKLNKKMIAGKIYDVSFYTNYSYVGINNNHCIAVEGIGVNFSDTAIPDNRSLYHLSLPYSVRSTPGVYLTDSLGWMQISGTYIAKGGEEYMTIGMFDEGKAVAYQMMYYYAPLPAQQRICYMFFDDVSVVPRCDTITRIHDTFACHTITPSALVTLTPPSPGGIYTWSTGSSTPAINVASPGTYFRTNDINGCDYSIDSFYLHEYKDFPTARHDTIYCGADDKAIITLNAIDSADTYLWSTNDTVRSIQVPKGSYVCVALKNCTFYTDSFNVTMTPLPGAVTASNNSPVCEGDTIFLSANDTSTKVTYRWAGPAGFTDTAKNTMIITTVEAYTGKYFITADRLGCKQQDSTNVVVNPSPERPRATSNSPVYLGTELKLELLNPVAGATYTWNGPNGFKSTLHNPLLNVVPGVAGSYTITAAVGNCFSSAVTIVIINGQEDTVSGFVLFPNPNYGNFTLRGKTVTDNPAGVKITDAVGKTIYTETVWPDNKWIDTDFKLEGRLASGVYFLHLVVDGRDLSFKFTVFL